MKNLWIWIRQPKCTSWYYTENKCCGSGMFIPDPNFSIPDQGSKRFRIPDPGVKKAPDPGSGSATLSTMTGFDLFIFYFFRKNVLPGQQGLVGPFEPQILHADPLPVPDHGGRSNKLLYWWYLIETAFSIQNIQKLGSVNIFFHEFSIFTTYGTVYGSYGRHSKINMIWNKSLLLCS